MSSTVESRRRARIASIRARVRNQRIRSSIRPDTRGTLPFFCECGTDHCDARVWLTLEDANEVIASGGPIIGEHVFRELVARRNSR